MYSKTLLSLTGFLEVPQHIGALEPPFCQKVSVRETAGVWDAHYSIEIGLNVF